MEICNEKKKCFKVSKRSTCLLLEMDGTTPETKNWLFRYIIIDTDKSSAIALD